MELQAQGSRQKMDLPSILAAFLCLITIGVALPNGAPNSACSSLLPRHPGFKSQAGISPYKVAAVKTGENKVTVTILAPKGEDFQGFVLQARSATDGKKIVPGEFKGESGSSKAIDCNGQKKNTLTHSSATPKTQVTAEWTSPVDEDIIFKATVAKDFSNFWENVDSEPVEMKSGESTPSEVSPKHSVYDGCWETNRCLGLPAKCVETSSCDVLLTHENIPDGTILFALHGTLKSSEYMAMALSEDALMGDDFVTECIRTGTNDGKLQHSWNVGKSNTGTTEASVKYEFTIEDGITTCTWIVENITSFNGRTFDLLNEKYHVLLAQGPVGNGRIQYHSNKQASVGPVQFFQSSEPTDSIHTDDDSTDNHPEEKRPAVSTLSNETYVENSGSHTTLSLLLFGLCFCGYLNFLLFYFVNPSARL